MTVVQGAQSADSSQNTGVLPGEKATAYMDRIQYTDSANKTHYVATLDDGLFLQTNGTAPAAVKLNDTIRLQDGANTAVSPVTSAGGVHTFRIDVTGLPLAYADEDGKVLTKIGDVYYRTEDLEDGAPKPGAVPLNPDQTKPFISLVGADGSGTASQQLQNLSSGLTARDGSTVSLADVTANSPVWNNAVNVGDLKQAVDSLTNGNAGGGFGLTGNDRTAAVRQSLGGTIAVQGGMTDSTAARTDKNTYVSVQELQGEKALVVEMAKELQDLTSLTTSKDIVGTDGKPARQTTVVDGSGVTIRTETTGDDPKTTVHTTLTARGLETEDYVAVAGADGVGGSSGPAAALSKDGSGAGHVVLQGKDGESSAAKADIMVVQGAAGLDHSTGTYEGTPYMDRLQYKDSASLIHAIATLDDGFILNTNGKNGSKVFLNQTVNVVDGAYTSVSAVTSFNGVHSFHIDVTGLPMEYADKTGRPLVRIGDAFYVKDSLGADGSVAGAEKADPVNVRLTDPSGRGSSDAPTLTHVGSGRRTGSATAASPWDDFFDDSKADAVAPMLNNGANIGDVKAAIDYISKAGAGSGGTGGFALTGNDGTARQDLGAAITVKGGMDGAAARTDKNTYISVQEGTKELVVEMAKELKDLTSVTMTGSSGETAVLNGGGLETSKTTQDEGGTKVVAKTTVTAGGIQTDDGTGNSYAASAAGSIVRDADGNQTETTSGGMTITAADGKTVSLTKDGLDNGGNQIKHVASGLTDENGKAVDDLSKAVDTNAANIGDLKSLYNNLTTNVINAIDTKPLTFAGDQGSSFERKLGEATNVRGGAKGNLTDGNIGVVSDGTNTLTVKLAEDLTGLKSVTANTITANTSLLSGRRTATVR